MFLFVLVVPHHGRRCFLVFIDCDHLLILAMSYTHTLQAAQLVSIIVVDWTADRPVDLLSD